MTERYVCARDIADALRVSRRAAQKRADRECWPWRSREGRGGGREYPLSALPREAQERLSQARSQTLASSPAGAAFLADRAEAELTAELAEKTRQQSVDEGNAAAPVVGRGAERLAARIELVRAAEAYCALGEVSYSVALRRFVPAYNAGEVAVSPETRRRHPEVSVTTLYRWSRRLRTRGAVALCGAYGNRRGAGAIDSQPEIREYLVGLLAEQPHLSASWLIAGLRARFGARDDIVVIPAPRTLRRWLARRLEREGELVTALANPDAWRSRYRTAYGKADAGIVRVNQQWEMDSSPADIICTDGRYTLLVVIDVRSRRALVLVARTSSSMGVTALLRRAILEWGVPERVRTDNGAEYISEHVVRALRQLAVAHDIAPPFSPERKPFVERFIGTLQRGLIEGLPGYIGHSVPERKAIEARKSFAERQEGRKAVQVALSAAELQSIIDRWAAHLYEHRPHAGLGGQSPWQVVAESADPVRRVPNERALDVLLSKPAGGGTRTATKKGIAIAGGWYAAPELAVGKQYAVLLNEASLGSIFCFDPEGGRFVAEALNLDRLGVDRAEVAEMSRRVRGTIMRTQIKEAKALARKVRTDDLVQEVLKERAESAGKLTRLRPAQSETWVTDGIAEAARAADFRARLSARYDDASAEVTPEIEAQVVRMFERSAAATETEDERFERALALYRLAPAARPPEEQRWLDIYSTTHEFRGRWIPYTDLDLGGRLPFPDAKEGPLAV